MDANEEFTTDTAPETATEAPEASVQDPNIIGNLTPEEQEGTRKIRAESQQLLAKVGEHELLKLRIIARIDELDAQGQAIINGISSRLGLEDGQRWAGMPDGTIRLVNPPGTGQAQGGGGNAS